MAQEILLLCVKVFPNRKCCSDSSTGSGELYEATSICRESVSLACGSGAYSNALKQNKRDGCNNLLMEKPLKIYRAM